jgi:hypothetical protein
MNRLRSCALPTRLGESFGEPQPENESLTGALAAAATSAKRPSRIALTGVS